MDLKNKKLSKSFFWSITEVIIKRVLDLGVKLVLARLLFPEDFGIIGMATVFISFIQVLNEGGMGASLIQKKQGLLNKTHFYTVFWTAVSWSLLLYLLISFILAPAISNFYNEDILNEIIPILSLTMIFSSLNVVHKSILMRKMRFKELAFINNTSTIIAGLVAIILAYKGFGVWSLVFNVLVSFFVSVPLFFFATKWTPKFIWKKKEFNEIFGFGVYTTGTQVLNNVASNIDYLIIGKLISSTVLGAYTLAFMLTNLVKAQVESMLNRVMFPFYSKIQSDILEVKKYYLNIIKYFSLLIYPAMLILIVFGEELVFILFGERWELTIFPMKILAVAVLVDVSTSSYGLLFRSVGKPEYEMKVKLLITVLFYIPAVLVGIYLNGIIGVTFGILLTKLFSFFIAQYILSKNFGISYSDLWKSLKPAILSLLGTLILIFLITNFFPNIYFIAKILLLLSIYFLISSLFLKNEIMKLKSLKNK